MKKGLSIKGFKPKKDVQEYFIGTYSGSNILIYQDLTEGEYFRELFVPLEFLNLLHEQFEILLHHCKKPLSVLNHLKGLGLEGLQYFYFLSRLEQFIFTWQNLFKDSDDYDKLNACQSIIEIEHCKITADLFLKGIYLK